MTETKTINDLGHRRCMMKWVLRAAIAMLGTHVGGALADLAPEPIGQVEQLPGQYPSHWLMVHDISFNHMLEGKVVVIDPLGATLGDQFKGMMTASFIASYKRSKIRNEHYVIESFHSRGGRGGQRTDVVSIYDPTTLSVTAEVIIPAKRITGMPKDIAAGLIGNDQFLAVYNFTPGQSVSIVDLAKREFVGEIPTAGCSFVIPNGNMSFTSICSNGVMLTSHLDDQGNLKETSKTEVLFDAQLDPVFEGAAVADGIAHLPTFSGSVLPLDVSGEKVKAGPRWSLLDEADASGWRPGGMRIAMTDSSGLGYFLMHPDGGEGTHKNGGSEVWVFDLAKRQRLARIELENWGVSIGTSGVGEQRMMFVTNTEMAIDVYDLQQRQYVKTLNIGAATPVLMHGAQ